MKAINEHFEVGQQYYALVSKEVLVVSEVLQPGMYPSGSGGYHMLEDLEFSYCTTIHKSQGQEYPVIIVPLLKEHYIMSRRNLLYTAVTRAKAKVILIGQKQAVFIAIHKCDVGQRNTVLADRIVAYYNRELSNRVT